MAAIGVATINEYEAEAVEAWLLKAGFTEDSVSYGVMQSRYTDWLNDEGDLVRHLNTALSGNLAMALATDGPFLRGKPLVQQYVLYGCAAGVPGRVDMGEVVVVREATYVENGLVRRDDNQEEKVLIKVDRLGTMTCTMVGGLTQDFLPGVFRRVKAFCSDKVIDADPKGPAGVADTREGQYFDIIRQRKSDIIDMESYGFLQALQPGRHRAALIVRVVTDFCGDRGIKPKAPSDLPWAGGNPEDFDLDDSQVAALDKDSRQRYLLRKNTWVLGELMTQIGHIEEPPSKDKPRRPKPTPHGGSPMEALLDALRAALTLATGQTAGKDRRPDHALDLAALDLARSLSVSPPIGQAVGPSHPAQDEFPLLLRQFLSRGYGDELLADYLDSIDLRYPNDLAFEEASRQVISRLAILTSPARAPVASVNAFLAYYALDGLLSAHRARESAAKEPGVLLLALGTSEFPPQAVRPPAVFVSLVGRRWEAVGPGEPARPGDRTVEARGDRSVPIDTRVNWTGFRSDKYLLDAVGGDQILAVAREFGHSRTVWPAQE